MVKVTSSVSLVTLGTSAVLCFAVALDCTVTFVPSVPSGCSVIVDGFVTPDSSVTAVLSLFVAFDLSGTVLLSVVLSVCLEEVSSKGEPVTVTLTSPKTVLTVTVLLPMEGANIVVLSAATPVSADAAVFGGTKSDVVLGKVTSPNTVETEGVSPLLLGTPKVPL